MEKFADKFGVLGTHLKNAQQSYSESDKLFEERKVRWKACGCGTDDAALENVQGTLDFRLRASVKKST